MTLQGVILGTAAYMSPEQARGQQVDTQADVWGLGCVLYEMLTGRRPFTGPTVTDVLAAVVRADPDWSALPVDAPRSVRDVLRRCLQKDTTRRLHHIADVRIELEDAVNESAASGEQAPPLRVTSRRAWLVAAVMGALAIGSIAWAFAFRSPAAPELRLEITTPPSPDPIFLALSPDGQTLAFVASDGGVQRIWLRSLSDTTPRPLPGTELAIAPFWSPDSRSLGFFADGKLKRIDLAGGATQTLASAPLGIGGSWNRNGDIVFAPSAVGGLYRVSANGGQAAAVTRVQAGETGHRLPHFLPDARHFVFYAQGTPTTRGIFVGDLDGTPVRRLIEASSSGVVTAGRLLFVREGALFSQPFDVHRQQLSGEASAVVDGIAFDGTTSAAALSVTPDGLLAYRTGGASGQRQLSWMDRAGRITGTLGAPDTASLFNPELSPDGKRVAINRTLDAPQDIWHMEVARGVLSRFTFHEQSDQIPVWSSDGQRVIFSSNRKGAYDLYEKPASGAREEQLLFESPQNKFAMGLSPDGRFLLYRNTAENTDWDLWVLPLDGDTSQSRKPVPVAQTSAQEMMGEFSPDGRWIAYQSNESGQYEIYVRSFPELSARVQISTDGGAQPRWRRDGKELFYIGLDGRLMAAPITFDTQGTLQVAAPIALFMTRTPGGPVPSPQKQQYAVAPDGQLFLINSLPAEATASPVTLVLNWNPERR
jgi:Tol biopolymer transport system component